MKTIKNKINSISIIILLLCFVSFMKPLSVQAQTGTALKVSRVLYLTSTTNNTGAQWTVPSGKVWKLTMFGANSSTACDYTIWINSTRAFFYCGYYNNSTYAGPGYRYSYSTGDLWLPQNTTVGTQLAASPNAFRWISGIEYEVVP